MGAETPEQATYERYRRVVGGLWLTDGNPEMPDSVEALPLILQRAWEAVTAQEPKRAPGADADRERYHEALQRIVDAVAAGDAAAVDKLARNALGLTRVRRPAPFQPAPELPGGSTPPDARPRADGRPGLDITCGSCSEDYGTNVPDPDEIECPECEARRCPNCQAWFGGSKW